MNSPTISDPCILVVCFGSFWVLVSLLFFDKCFEMMMTHPHHDSHIRMPLEYNLPETFEAKANTLNGQELRNENDELTGSRALE